MGTPHRPDSTTGPAATRPSQPATGRPRLASPTLRGILAYQACDGLSAWLIYFAIIFSPWAYGTTQPWAIGIMNAVGYGLGLLLLVKLFVRKGQGYRAPRWDDPREAPGVAQPARPRLAITALGGLTVAIVAFCLIAAWNAYSTYNPLLTSFDQHHYLPWLPHSYDSVRSWQAFANYLALAGWFWAVRDWLLGKTDSEARADQGKSPAAYLPHRLRRLLWVLSINGGLLGIEGIAQRLSGTNHLLWLQPTRINAEAQYQFGPYAYRSNAAQYFILAWPVALGLWWILRREIRHGLRAATWRAQLAGFLLLTAIMVMAACPIITLSRAGAILTVGNMAAAAALLVFALRRRGALTQFGVVLFFAGATALGLWFEWDNLGERMKLAGEGLRDREATYETARQITRDFPAYGTGPGTFEPVFQLYRSSLDEYWPKQLHNDWLETRITFGWVGSGLIALAFLLATTRWFSGQGIPTGWRFTSMLWLALTGCLLYALFDFPMQIYSTLLLFLLICAILSTLGRRSKPAAV